MYMGILFIPYMSYFPVLNTEQCSTKHNPLCLISWTRFPLTFHCMTGWNEQIITYRRVFWGNNICVRSSVVTLLSKAECNIALPALTEFIHHKKLCYGRVQSSSRSLFYTDLAVLSLYLKCWISILRFYVLYFQGKLIHLTS